MAFLTIQEAKRMEQGTENKYKERMAEVIKSWWKRTEPDGIEYLASYQTRSRDRLPELLSDIEMYQSLPWRIS